MREKQWEGKNTVVQGNKGTLDGEAVKFGYSCPPKEPSEGDTSILIATYEDGREVYIANNEVIYVAQTSREPETYVIKCVSSGQSDKPPVDWKLDTKHATGLPLSYSLDNCGSSSFPFFMQTVDGKSSEEKLSLIYVVISTHSGKRYVHFQMDLPNIQTFCDLAMSCLFWCTCSSKLIYFLLVPSSVL